MVCACLDELVATVMPHFGEGSFRFEDSCVARFRGTGFAPSKSGGVAPDASQIFSSKDQLENYLATLPTSTTEVSRGLALARRFFDAFREGILRCDIGELQRASCSKTRRTQLYANWLFPMIAKELGLVHGKEEFKIDHVAAIFSSNEHLVPVIYIESENEFARATHEIRKLCSLNSPLRVLVTFTTKPFTAEPATGAYQQLREWQSIVRSHHEINQDFLGTIALVIAYRKCRQLSFSACAFHRNANLSWPLSVLVERDVG